MQEHEGKMRYQMLETIREYAREKSLESGEAERVRDLHLDFFMKLAEETEPKLEGAEQAFWLEQLEVEQDNLRAALDWSLTRGDLGAGMSLAGALWSFWDVHGYFHEGRLWLDRMLAESQTARFSTNVIVQAKVFYGAGRLSQRQGDLQRASELCRTSLDIYQRLDDKKQIGLVLMRLGEIAQEEGDLVSAKRLFEESVALLRSLGNVREYGFALGYLSFAALIQGDFEQVSVLSAEILALGQERGDQRTIAAALAMLGYVSWSKGEPEKATIQFRDALTLQATLRDKLYVQYSLMGMALVALTSNQPVHAARLFGAAESVREAIGTPMPPSQRPRYDLFVAAIRGQLEESAFEQAWAEGHAMTLEQAIEFALEENSA